MKWSDIEKIPTPIHIQKTRTDGFKFSQINQQAKGCPFRQVIVPWTLKTLMSNHMNRTRQRIAISWDFFDGNWAWRRSTTGETQDESQKKKGFHVLVQFNPTSSGMPAITL